MATFSQKNCEQVGANLSLLDLFKFLRFDLLEEFDDRAIVLAKNLVLWRDVVWEQLREEQVQRLQVAHHAFLQGHAEELTQR